MCHGEGQYTHIEANYTSGDNVGSTEVLQCHRCEGIGQIEIKSSDSRFLKLYKDELKKEIDLCLKELKKVREDEIKLIKHCEVFIKEYDKILNN